MAVKFIQKALQAQEPVQQVVPLPKLKADHYQVQELSPEAAALELLEMQQTLELHGVFDLLKRMDMLKKRLQSIADGELDPYQPLVIETALGTVEISACDKKTVITDKAKLIETLGEELFKQIATVSLKDAKTYLSAVALAPCTNFQPGSRSVKAHLKHST